MLIMSGPARPKVPVPERDENATIEAGVGEQIWTGHLATVTAGGPAEDLAFAVDWSTATADSSATADVTDNGKWDRANNANNPSTTGGRITVLDCASTGFSWPSGMANCLAIRYESTTGTYCNLEMDDTGTGLPAIGSSIWFRMYFCHDVAGATGADTRHHPVQMAAAAGSTYPYLSNWEVERGDTFGFYLSCLGGSSAESGGIHAHRWLLTSTLTRGQVYRVEEQYERLGAESWRLYVRIYNSSNTLIYDQDDFSCFTHNASTHNTQHGINSANLGTFMAAGGIVQSSGTEKFVQKMLTNQGVGATGDGSSDTDHDRIYYGGVAVSLSDWCGAYVLGERT